MRYVFGQDFTYYAFLYGDRRALSELPAQSVDLYLYDSRPNRSNAATGSGAIAGPYTCVLAGGEKALSFAVDAIDDPAPEGAVYAKEYWVSFLFKLSDGEQSQLEIAKIRLSRPHSKSQLSGITSSAVFATHGSLREHYEDHEVDQAIVDAEERILDMLEDRLLSWIGITEPSQLRELVLSRTLESLFLDLILSAGDRFSALADRHAQNFNNTLTALRLTYDATFAPQQPHERRAGGFIYGMS